jgi:hypothetical protein
MLDMKNMILMVLAMSITGCSFAGEVTNNPNSAKVECNTVYYHGGALTYIAAKDYQEGVDLSLISVEGEEGSYYNMGTPSYPNTHTLSPIIHGTQVYVECGAGGEKDYTGFKSVIFTEVQK